MTYHTPVAPRLSGSILHTLIAVFSLTLITACGGVSLSGNLNINDPRAVCATDPFEAICTEFTKERNAFIERCAAEDATVPEGICESAITSVCPNNPFPTICNAEQQYLDARKVIVDACVEGTCTVPQLAQFCTANPYNDRCDDLAYDAARAIILATCSTANKHELCSIAIVGVCMANPFNAVCQGDTTYEDARTSAVDTCNSGFVPLTDERCQNAIAAVCVGAGISDNPVLCDGVVADVAVTGTCNADRFATACNDIPEYIESRREFCLATATASDNRCPAVVTSTCTANPFHGLCQTGTTYDTPRATAITDCLATPLGSLCPAATLHTCANNPFHALCSATSYDSDRSAAVTNCADGTTTITEQICADAAMQTCEGDTVDIFNALCITYSGQSAQSTACSDNDDATRCYLAEQIDACARGTETARCAGVSTNADIMACIVDPFATACVAGSGFASYLAVAQGARYDYCGAASSDTDTLCASYRACKTKFDDGETPPVGCGINFDSTLRDTCAATPFDPQCASDNYNSDKVAFCSINTPAAGGVDAVNNLFNPNCTTDYQDTTKRNDFCTADPFHASCSTNPAYATLRDTNCKGAASARHASCVTPVLYATVTPTGPSALNATKYRDSVLYVTIEQDNAIAPLLGDLFTPEVTATVPVPPGSPEGTEPTTRIVTPEISIDSADIGPIVVGRRGGAGTKTVPNFNDDGWAFFTLTREGEGLASTRTSRHVAILPTTNLGAPLRAAPVTAVWPGHFRTTATVDQTPVDFYIDYGLRRVGFSSPTKVGIGNHLDTNPTKNHAEDRPLAARSNKIRIDVRWYESGVLYGFIEINDDDLAIRDSLIVNGLIGQEGLVAVGYSNANKGGAGGFTASNPSHPDYVPAVVAENENDAETDGDENTNLVNYEDWIDSGARPKRERTGPRQSEILQTTTFTDNRRGLLGLVNGANARIVDFDSTTNFRSPLLRVDGGAINGFAVLGEASNFYAGVLHTADLGAPITQTQGSATWRGYLFAADSTATIGKHFNLTVTFNSNHEGQVGTLTGNIHNDIDVGDRSGLLYAIEARFNARGAISGDISRSLEINTVQKTFITPLSGIIGQKGAIGVFASNDAESKFAGGFVAIPNRVQNANYDIWARSTPLTPGGGLLPTPRAFNHWLTSGANGLSITGISAGSLTDRNRVTGTINLASATWKRLPLGGAEKNGVDFYTGVLNGGRFFYSGVKSGTDLGKPLTRISGTATWVGHLAARQSVGVGGVIQHRSGDIVLTINFNPTGGRITGVLEDNGLTSIDYNYEIGADFNEDGFLRGNVNTRRIDGAFEQGFVTGVIGEQGVVAAFVAPNFSGGFVARPGTPPGFRTRRGAIAEATRVTTYDDWAHFTGQRFGAIRSLPHNESGQHNSFLHTSPQDGNNVPWGNIGQDGSREHTGRGAYGVGAALTSANLTAPAGLAGGFSWLAGYWDRQDSVPETSTTLNRGYHAGLFRDTNVGLPLGTSSHLSSVTANWGGWFYAHQNKTFASSVNTSGPVRFLVNYGANRITITGGGNTIGGLYSIEGYDRTGGLQWDERGVISGLIHHSDANIPSGDVTGLIGQRGLVAVFVSRADSGTKPHHGYAGGFVACPLTRSNACID